jgi:hypothetical protein
MSESTADNIANREQIIADLKAELIGPRPAGEPIDCSGPIAFEDKSKVYEPRMQAGTGEEILWESPLRRYGAGILYPVSEAIGSGGEIGSSEDEEAEEGDARGADSDDFSLSMANAMRPCSMAVSFMIEDTGELDMTVVLTGGRYAPKEIQAENEERMWWLRSAVEAKYQTPLSRLSSSGTLSLTLEPVESTTGDLNLSLEVRSRPQRASSGKRLLTVSVVNRSDSGPGLAENCLFQSEFTVTFGSEKEPIIVPYPAVEQLGGDAESESRAQRLAREEEESLALMYRHSRTYGVGHGCAADWEKAPAEENRAQEIRAVCMPVFEAPHISPDVEFENGLELDMAALAGLKGDGEGVQILRSLAHQYDEWISRKEEEIGHLDARFQAAGRRNLSRARDCVDRMREGIALLRSDQDIRRAFELANHAILIQQVRGDLPTRSAKISREKKLEFSSPHPDVDILQPGPRRGKWRAFQLAFILMSLASTADGDHEYRPNVELIWFPTGGGKTEAYLGLIAFSIFLRYLRDPKDCGVQVLMRYTLRLLTAQQFQRASALICAMESLREEHLPEVERPISIGIWVGSATTPNTRKQADKNYRGLRQKQSTQKKFVVTACPWCHADMGLIDHRSKRILLGYEPQGGSIAARCPDTKCRFHQGLPVYMVDEDIYEQRPDFIIGTVDKFAMLAMRPQARALFGLDDRGERFTSPPGLIIQDELHLISGPLGSMVGLYEGLITELCTDRRHSSPVAPKFVSSTATIRRYRDQIKSLYAVDDVTLFPPPELEEGDTFFGRYARDSEGKLLPGKKYVGIHAPGLRSMQTVQVRTFAALLMSTVSFPEDEQDPWWTLLAFYNSLRELGGAHSLFQDDIPEYIRGIGNRTGADQLRYIDEHRIVELTGRISGEEVTQSLSDLSVATTDSENRAKDVCLASSMIEVGVDIDRLSLMAVVGQPKTTSQYIQVTGRVGRQAYTRPGLIITLYSSSRPRDRSHFEKFRSYHERLYAQVEPTSVTPFSAPALKRALHAVMVAHFRQFSEIDVDPYPVSSDTIDHLQEVLENRVRTVNKNELDTFREYFVNRLKEWNSRKPEFWKAEEENPGLIHFAGSYISPEHRKYSWPVPGSMRTVDAESALKISLPPLDTESL